MITYIISITPSPAKDRGNEPKTRPGIESPKQGDVIPNLPVLEEIPTLQDREEASPSSAPFLGRRRFMAVQPDNYPRPRADAM